MMQSKSQCFRSILSAYWRIMIHKASKECIFRKEIGKISFKKLGIKNKRQKVYYCSTIWRAKLESN